MDIAVSVAGAESSLPQVMEVSLLPSATGGLEVEAKAEVKTDMELPSATGGLLPELPRIRWEWKKDGSVECWDLPYENAPRSKRIYLKRAGKRLLQEWQSLPRVERNKVIRQWVSSARVSKAKQKQNHRQKDSDLQ